MRTRRATTLLLAAAVLCAAVRSSAEDAPAAALMSAAHGPSLSGAAAYKTPDALKLHEQFAAHEKNVLFHLTGRKTLSFAELRKRQSELADGLEQTGNLPAEERDALTADLQKIGRLLFVAEPLARGGARLDPRLEQVLRETADGASKDPADALMQVSGQLLHAAANPADAAAVFDNLARRLGGEPGSKTNLNAVRLDFGTKTPLTFTPADDPRTLAGIMSIKEAPPAPQTQIPARAAAAPSGPTAAVALLAAYKPFRLLLPDGEEKRFSDERQKQLADVRTLAEAAERSFGGDPSTMGFDALVERLIAREERVARNVGVGGPITDFSTIPARLAAVRKVNPELATFMASVWLYRRFLRQEMVDNHVALGTTFKPWETSPDGHGTLGATLEGYERDGVHFVGLSYRSADGSTRFQGASREGRKGLVILSSKTEKTITAVDFDGSGKVTNAVSELYQNGVLTRKEIVDAAKAVSEIHTFENGKEIKVATVNGDGRRRIQDLLHDVDTFITKDGAVEIHSKPAPAGTPPVPVLQVGALDAQGNFIVQKVVMQNGQQILTISPHVTEMLSDKKVLQGWNVEIGDLVRAEDPAARQAKAHDYAVEIVKALFGSADADKAKVLEGFLLDYAKSGPDVAVDAKGNPSVRLFINERKTFMLMFGKKDGTRRIVSGVFKGGPEFEGRAQGSAAFGVMGEITAGSDGKIRQDDPTIQYEYLFDGTRLHWAPPATETISAPIYKFWQDDQKVTHFFLQREVRSGSAWRAAGKPSESQKAKLEQDVEGTSWTGWAARGVSNAPILGQTLNFVGDGLGTIYKGAHYAVDAGVVGVMDVSGADQHSIDQMRVERDANLANNPLSKVIVGGIEPDPVKDPEGWRAYHQKQVDAYADDVTPGQRAILAARAKTEREKNLAAKGWTADRAPEAFASAMLADASSDEIYGSFSHFGAGSYGGRLAESGHPWLGMAVQGTEVVVESLPAGFALGLIGKGAEGMQYLAKVLPKGGAIFRVGEVGLRGLDYVLKPAIVMQVGLMGMDHIGKAFQYQDDPTKFAINAGNALGDLAFGGLMLHGWLGNRGGGLDEMKKDVDKALKSQAVPPVTETVVVAEKVEALDVRPTPPDVAIPLNGLTGDIKIPAGDGVKIPASEVGASPNVGAPAAPGVKAPVDAGVKAPADAGVKAPADAAPAGGRFGWLKSMLKPSLADLLTRAEVEATKLTSVKTESAVDEIKAPARATGEANVPAGEGLKVEATAKGEVVDASAKAPAKPALDESSAERIEPAAKGEKLETRRVELKAGDEKAAEPAVKNEVADKSEKTAEADKSEKTPTPERAERADATERADKTEKADRTEEKAPRTDRLGRWSDKFEKKTWKVGSFVAIGPHPLPVTPPRPSKDPNSEGVVPVDPDAPVQPADRENPPANPKDPPEDPKTDPAERATKVLPVRSPVDPNATNNNVSTNPMASVPGGGPAGGPAGGPSDKHPKVPTPGGFGGGGGGGGAGGGGGSGGGGSGGGAGADNSAPKGGGAMRAPAANEIAAAAPSDAHPAPFLPPSVAGARSGITPNGAGLNGGHSPSPSLAARFDGARERPRRAAPGTADSMKGLGAGGDGGLPKLTPREAPPKAPVPGADPELKDTTSASANAYSAGAPAPAAGLKSEDEDYNYTYLAPARHKYELPTDREQGSRDWRYLLELGLQGSAALAAVYLFYHSDLGYLLGMSRRRKKTGTGEES